VREVAGKGVYETREGVTRGKVTWLAGDFFRDEFLSGVEGGGSFDLIYDYTVRTSTKLLLGMVGRVQCYSSHVLHSSYLRFPPQ